MRRPASLIDKAFTLVRETLPLRWHALAPRALFLALLLVQVGVRPLYTSNQNSKFLHGAAQARVGSLDQDWTANTRDPLPVFTSLVRVLYQLDSIQAAYPLFLLLVAVYGYSLLGIARYANAGSAGPFQRLLLGALLVLAYSPLWPFAPDSALAGQYLISRATCNRPVSGSCCYWASRWCCASD